MKRIMRNAAAIAMAIALPLHALERETNPVQNLASDFYPYTYFGIGFGSMKVSSDTYGESWGLASATLLIGHQFTPIWGIEGVIDTAMNDKTHRQQSSFQGVGVTLDYMAFSAFATARNPGKYFVKGLIGLSYAGARYSADGYEPEDERNIGLAYGVGAGMEHNNHIFSLTYIQFPESDDALVDGGDYSARNIALTWSFTY